MHLVGSIQPHLGHLLVSEMSRGSSSSMNRRAISGISRFSEDPLGTSQLSRARRVVPIRSANCRRVKPRTFMAYRRSSCCDKVESSSMLFIPSPIEACEDSIVVPTVERMGTQ